MKPKLPEPVHFAGMSGMSIAGRDAAPWVTDFLNAAYYRRPVDERAVDDLRLAFCVLTTFWWRKEARLHISDLPAFHRAFGRDRLSSRGLLDREQLLAGAGRLLGDWFPEAYETRRGWGIAFPDDGARDAYVPESRLELARLDELTPAQSPDAVLHTYDPVAMPSAERVVDALTRPEAWPDYASELGRFTPLRTGGLDGQTFEIEVLAGTGSGRPLLTRGYVTVTRVATAGEELRDYFAAVEEGLAAQDEPRAVPEGGTPVVGFDLTTHRGHFMGSGHNRLLLYEHEGRAWARAAGTWDPMPWHVAKTYETAGREAQRAFWGEGGVERLSMLHQLALAAA